MPALLVLDAARIESAGVTGEPLTFAGGSERVALLGNFRPLFRLLAGDARLAAGRAELAGTSVGDVVRLGTAGLAPLDPPLVPGWTVERHLDESARLAGLAETDAARAVETALTNFELVGMRRVRLETLFPPVRRALVLAGATLTGPAVLCAEAPFSELDAQGQAYVAVALERAAFGRRLLCSVSTRLPEGMARGMVERADWVVEEHGGRIVREGPSFVPESRLCYATVTHSGQKFLAALATRGLDARATPVPPIMDGGAAGEDGPLRVVAALPKERSPTDLVLAAHAAGAPLIELEVV
jgi:hypothetical protein